jgi:hypothetical protein
MLKGDVAVFVGGGAAEKGDVKLEALVEKVLFTLEIDYLDEIVRRGLVHFAALNARVYESTEADLGEKAGTARGDLAPKVYDNALGQAVALELVFKSKVAESKGAADVSAAPSGDEAGACFAEMSGSAGLPVAHGAALLEVKVTGMTGLLESVADSNADFLGPACKTHSADADSGMIGDKSSGFLSGNKFSHYVSSCLIMALQKAAPIVFQSEHIHFAIFFAVKQALS